MKKNNFQAQGNQVAASQVVNESIFGGVLNDVDEDETTVDEITEDEKAYRRNEIIEDMCAKVHADYLAKFETYQVEETGVYFKLTFIDSWYNEVINQKIWVAIGDDTNEAADAVNSTIDALYKLMNYID